MRKMAFIFDLQPRTRHKISDFTITGDVFAHTLITPFPPALSWAKIKQRIILSVLMCFCLFYGFMAVAARFLRGGSRRLPSLSDLAKSCCASIRNANKNPNPAITAATMKYYEFLRVFTHLQLFPAAICIARHFVVFPARAFPKLRRAKSSWWNSCFGMGIYV